MVPVELLRDMPLKGRQHVEELKALNLNEIVALPVPQLWQKVLPEHSALLTAPVNPCV